MISYVYERLYLNGKKVNSVIKYFKLKRDSVCNNSINNYLVCDNSILPFVAFEHRILTITKN